MRTPTLGIACLALFLGILPALRAWADPFALAGSIAQLTVSETAPSAFTPIALKTSDFSLEWLGPKPESAEAHLVEGSLEWVRVAENLVLPRATVCVTLKTATSGQIEYASYVHPVKSQKDQSEVCFSMALISGESNAATLRLPSGATAKLIARFEGASRGHKGELPFHADNSCSNFGVRARVLEGDPSATWMFVGCRLKHLQGYPHKSTELELAVFWDNVGQSIRVSGVTTASTAANLFALSGSGAQTYVLKSRDLTIELSAFSPEIDHYAKLGLGLGPYTYTFRGPGVSKNTTAPMVTLYGSYYLNDTTRIVTFDATTINADYNTDVGVYISLQSAKALDNRFTLNLMFGAHAFVFGVNGASYFRPSAPQGLEMSFKDFLVRRYNLSLGAFLYPLIANKSYTNIWLRWGSQVFGELNYLSWRDTVGAEGTQDVYSRSVGISVGFPLASFL